MTTVDLVRIARSIIPPVGATQAIARVDDQLKYRAAFLIDGRVRSYPVGPAFDRPRDAIRLVDLLNGEAPRPRLDDSAGAGALTSGGDRAETEAPGGLGASPRTCANCGRDLPPGSRPQRRTCSGACRVAAKRHPADTDGAVTVSAAPEPSTAVNDTGPTLGL